MKLNKLSLVAALSLSMAGLCNADSIVYLTGSTACRTPIANMMFTNGAVFVGTPSYAYYTDNTNLAGAVKNYMMFKGQLVGNSPGVNTTILCHWSGSEAGIADLVSNIQETFPDPSVGGIFNSGNNTTVPPGLITNGVDIAMADNAQQYSKTKSPGLAHVELCAIAFKWIRNNGAWGNAPTNVTDSQIRQALFGGAKLAVFSGNPGDTNSYVYVQGRDSGSGTRVNTFGITQFGISQIPKQIETGQQSGAMQQSANNKYLDDFGWANGGDLAFTFSNETYNVADTAKTNSLANNGAGLTNFAYIAYLGVSDAKTATGIVGGGTECQYDGVSFTSAGVLNGSYNFWGNEYINIVTGESNPDATLVYGLINGNSGTYGGLPTYATYDGVVGNAFPVTFSFNSMNVSRNGPTSDIAHN